MSTKRDPVIAVIKYFEEADLALATQALALCQQTLRRRKGPQQLRLKPSKPAKAAKPEPLAMTSGQALIK